MSQKQIWQLLIIVFVVVWSTIEITPPTGRNLIEEFKNSARAKDQALDMGQDMVLDMAQGLVKGRAMALNREMVKDLG